MLRTFLACGFALALLGSVATETAAQTSCSGWYSKCSARCKTNADKNCVSNTCGPKLASCRQSGCWEEAQRFGGGKNCNLKK
jgi:hypothetical protein